MLLDVCCFSVTSAKTFVWFWLAFWERERTRKYWQVFSFNWKKGVFWVFYWRMGGFGYAGLWIRRWFVHISKEEVYWTKKEKIIMLSRVFHLQDVSESLGISIAGGVMSQRGDTPVYVTNINQGGCIGRCRQVKVSAFCFGFESQMRTFYIYIYFMILLCFATFISHVQSMVSLCFSAVIHETSCCCDFPHGLVILCDIIASVSGFLFLYIPPTIINFHVKACSVLVYSCTTLLESSVAALAHENQNLSMIEDGHHMDEWPLCARVSARWASQEFPGVVLYADCAKLHQIRL